MFYKEDTELGAHVMRFDSITEIVRETAKNTCKANWSIWDNNCGTGWTWKDCKNFDDVMKRLRSPWIDGLKMVGSIIDRVSEKLPPPVSRQRKPRWSECDGSEVCSDRWRTGEDYWRTVSRREAAGSNSVCIITNLDAISSNSGSDVFLRGAGAIALADMLENAGYEVEIHAWLQGRNVYDEGTSGQFTAIRLKEIGAPLNIGSMINSLTSEFLRTVVFSSFCVAEDVNYSLGAPVKTLGKFQKYMEVSGDSVMYMPIVHSEDEVVSACAGVLKVFEETKGHIEFSDWEEKLAEVTSSAKSW
jgi:hypothetical protein